MPTEKLDDDGELTSMMGASAGPLPERRPNVTADDDATQMQSPATEPQATEISTEPVAVPIPGYRVLREIARGGMGRVLAGYDLTLERDVALKILLPGASADRFVRESKITARLPHPGIPPVYALGTLEDGSPFLAMKLIAGQTLAEELKSADRPRLLQVFIQVCQAVGFAHSRGVIHRDIKPTNIMVGSFGEVQVMDWGLSKDLASATWQDAPQAPQGPPSPVTAAGDTDIQTIVRSNFSNSTSDQTQAGAVMGTPAYMAPEQARGELTDARADVFALGGLLCAIITGKPPFSGRTSREVILRASTGDLAETQSRLDACGADAELVALCRCCLSANPADRPPDGQAVADAVMAYLNGVQQRLQRAQLIAAESRARSEEETKSRRLKRVLVGALLAALAAGVLVSGWFAIRAGKEAVAARTAERHADERAFAASEATKQAAESAESARRSEAVAQSEARRANDQAQLARENLAEAERARKDEQQQRDRADREAEVAQRNLFHAQMHLAQQSWREHRGLGHMRELLANWIPRGESPDRRGWEWFYLNSLPYQNLQTLQASGKLQNGCVVAWHWPTRRLAAGTREGLIQVWDVDREQRTLTLRGPGGAGEWWGGRWFAWSPDGSTIAAGFQNGTVHLWETRSGRELAVLGSSNSWIRSVAYSANGARLAVWNDNTIDVWDTVARERVVSHSLHVAGLCSGAWSPDDSLFATGDHAGIVTITDAGTGRQVARLQGHASGVFDLAWSADSRQLATSSRDFTTRIWDVASARVVSGPLRHSHEVIACAWQPGGQRLATGSIDETVKVWNVAAGREEVTLRGNIHVVNSVAFGPDGQLASGANDGSMRIWRSLRDQEAMTLPGGGERLTAVAWSPDGQKLAWAGDDGQIKIWNPETGAVSPVIQGHDVRRINGQFGLIRTLAWSPTGAQIASGGLDGAARIWDAVDGREILTLPASQGAVWSVAWNRDGTRLAIGSQDGTIRVLEGLGQSPRVRTFPAHTGNVRSLAFSPQGNRLASGGGSDFTIRIWDPARGTELTRLQGHRDSVMGVAWSPDGQRLASASADQLVLCWDVDSGTRLSTMRGHNDFVDQVVWSPDGTRLASAGLDNTVRIWSPRSGEETFILRGTAGMFHDVSWNIDGARLAAASSDGQIWIWDATRGFERDSTPRALPYIERRIAAGTARGEDLQWFAETYIRAGKHREALDLLRTTPQSLAWAVRIFEQNNQPALVAEARDLLRQSLEQRRVAEPDNETVVSELAELLLTRSGDRWKVIKPSALSSREGSIMALQPDGSILVSGTNAPGDHYTISFLADVDRIAAVRLEVLPDANLPNGGSGRHPSGNFQVSAVRLAIPSADGSEDLVSVPFASAWASFDYRAWDADIAGTIDESLNKVWHVWGRQTEPHTAVFMTAAAVPVRRGGTSVLTLQHRDIDFAINLGRFRLSISEDPVSDQKRLEALKIVQPWARLAMAYHLAEDSQSLNRLLELHPVAVSGLGDYYASIGDWNRAIDAYDRAISAEANDAALLARRAAALVASRNWDRAVADWKRVGTLQPSELINAFAAFSTVERWHEAAEFGLQVIGQNPDDPQVWLRIAPVAALAGDPQVYADFCDRLLQRFAGADQMEVVDKVVKASLLRAAAVDLERVPGSRLASQLDSGKGPNWLLPWGWGTRALWAYRTGDFQSAVECVERSEKYQPIDLTRSLTLSLLAMARQKLQQSDAARKALDEASQLIERLGADAANAGNVDLQIARILYAEAQALISGQAMD